MQVTTKEMGTLESVACVVVVVVGVVMDDDSRMCLSTPGTPNTMH